MLFSVHILKYINYNLSIIKKFAVGELTISLSPWVDQSANWLATRWFVDELSSKR